MSDLGPFLGIQLFHIRARTARVLNFPLLSKDNSPSSMTLLPWGRVTQREEQGTWCRGHLGAVELKWLLVNCSWRVHGLRCLCSHLGILAHSSVLCGCQVARVTPILTLMSHAIPLHTSFYLSSPNFLHFCFLCTSVLRECMYMHPINVWDP